MPVIGLKYCIAAKITSHVPGQMPTYDTGFMVGQMMQSDLTWNRVNVKQSSNNAVSDYFDGITGGTLTIGVNDIDQTAKVAMGIDVVVEGETKTYSLNLEPDGYSGIGIMKVKQTLGKMSYLSQILLKTQIGITSESARTMGENIEFQSPTLTGEVMPIAIDNTMKNRAEIHQEFDTEAEAYQWLCQKLSYTPPTQNS